MQRNEWKRQAYTFKTGETRHYDGDGLFELITTWHRYRNRRYMPVPLLLPANFNIFFWMFMFADEEQRFHDFYEKTRMEFFDDESVSVFADIRCELRPHMLAYFLHAMHDFFTRDLHKERIFAATHAHLFLSYESQPAADNGENDEQQETLEEKQERRDARRRSKRRRIVRFAMVASRAAAEKDVATTATTSATTMIDACDDDDNVGDAGPQRPVRRSECNVVQWKRHQVQARKELHRAVLEYDFADVQRIVERWHSQSQQERLLDFGAVEWALRRICKQLLPMAEAKAQLARQNGIAMIDTLMECFSSMHLCQSLLDYNGETCMRQHLRNIVAALPHRADIDRHVAQMKCECCP
jgi:hypothetical protein